MAAGQSRDIHNCEIADERTLFHSSSYWPQLMIRERERVEKDF